MDLSAPWEIDSPAVIADEIAGETLVINLKTGAYYVIPPGASAVWRLISSGTPAQDLLAGPDDPRAQHLYGFMEAVEAAGLLRPAQSNPSSGSVPEWDAEALVIEEHTDMADLLGLDPIHDADGDLGWPIGRRA